MNLKFFKSPAAFRRWLQRHHDSEQELWVGYYKKSTGRPTITWPESVDQALCFGWIDGIRKSIDDISYASRFTPRRPRSNWSAVNLRRVQVLIEEGLMQPAGLMAFEARDQNHPANAQSPPQLDETYERQLRANENAWAFFQAQTPRFRRLAGLWVMSAKKEETRLRRLAILIESAAQGKSFSPLLPAKKNSAGA